MEEKWSKIYKEAQDGVEKNEWKSIEKEMFLATLIKGKVAWKSSDSR